MTSFLIADFATRLAFGVVVSLLFSRWREIPPQFFRTMSLVVLGVLILAAFDFGFNAAPVGALLAAVVGCVAAYVAAVAWGLGLVRIGQAAFVGVLLGAILAQVFSTNVGASATVPWSMVWPIRALSGWLMGATLTAMLLGHHYLTAPAMSVSPLIRMIVLMAVALGCQAGLSLISSVAQGGGWGSNSSVLLLVMRWGFGIIAPAFGTFLAYRTAVIRSTQSATGILYAVTTLVFLGELSALVLAQTRGVAG